MNNILQDDTICALATGGSLSPIAIIRLSGNNAINIYRDIMGATNPEEAKDNTIRKIHGLNIQENSVHGSDSEENAKKEILFFFTDDEIVG